MFNDFKSNVINWNGRLTPQDVVDFLSTIGEATFDLVEDWEFWSENNRILSANDIFSPVRRLGKTEERYKKEIEVYDRILIAKDFIFPPRAQRQQSLQYYDPYYSPAMAEYNKHCNLLTWHTDNIPIYVSIRYGKEGVDWILDKFGEKVKNCYYERCS